MISHTIRTNRRFMKIERIVRLELQGYSDEEIGLTLGITKQYVSMLRATPEFIGIRTQIASGVLAQLDTDVNESIKMSQDQLKEAVPNAILVIKNTMLDSNLAPKLRFEAAKEICDREGTFAKVSKSEVKETKKFSFDINDAIATDLLQSIQLSTSKKELLEANAEFTNTLEADSKTQTDLNTKLDLETLNMDSTSIQ